MNQTRYDLNGRNTICPTPAQDIGAPTNAILYILRMPPNGHVYPGQMKSP